MLLLLSTLALAGSADVGPWNVTWSDTTITVKDGSSTSVELKDTSKQGESKEWKVVGVVGPWVTVEHTWYYEGGAHPSYGQIWVARDITRPGAPRVDLTDLWPEKVVLDALLADKVVQQARKGATGRPETVQALLQSLDGGCDMDLGPRLQSAWVIHSVRGDKVAVRLGASHGCEVARGNFTQLGVWLPIPDGMKTVVQQADQRGTLYEDLK